MTVPTQDQLHQQFYTFIMMHLSAAAISDKLLSFAGWLLTGFAAIVGLIVANIDKVSPYICAPVIGNVVKLFIATAVIHLVQRYFALMVSAGAQMALTTKDLPPPPNFNAAKYTEDFSLGMYSLPRKFIMLVVKKMNEGDFLFGPRVSLKLGQWQMLFVFFQSALAISAIWMIANSL